MSDRPTYSAYQHDPIHPHEPAGELHIRPAASLVAPFPWRRALAFWAYCVVSAVIFALVVDATVDGGHPQIFAMVSFELGCAFVMAVVIAIVALEDAR